MEVRPVKTKKGGKDRHEEDYEDAKGKGRKRKIALYQVLSIIE